MKSRNRAVSAPGTRGVIHAVLLAPALLTLVAAAAHAGDFASGGMLARACASRSAGENSLCDGYIAGALDVVAGSAELRSRICVPPNTRLSALREAVGRYGQGHVDDTKASGLALLAATMRADYPCPAK